MTCLHVAMYEGLPSGYALYVVGTHPFDVDARCALLDVEELDDPDEHPALVGEHELNYTLSTDQMEDIIVNAQLQKTDVTPAELVDAFNFYLRTDAFIDLNEA